MNGEASEAISADTQVRLTASSTWKVCGKPVAGLLARPAGGVALAGVPASSSPPVQLTGQAVKWNSPWALCLGGRSCPCAPSCVVTLVYTTRKHGSDIQNGWSKREFGSSVSLSTKAH